MNTEPLQTDEWCDRCAKRFTELDHDISGDEAQQIAHDVHAFERTRAMGPEGAADFVAFEMSHPGRSRIERRSVDRKQSQPLPKNILHMLTPGAPGA